MKTHLCCNETCLETHTHRLDGLLEAYCAFNRTESHVLSLVGRLVRWPMLIIHRNRQCFGHHVDLFRKDRVVAGAKPVFFFYGDEEEVEARSSMVSQA